MKYGLKVIGINSYYACGSEAIKTERGYEKWLSIDNTFIGWPEKPIKLFDLNDAFRYVSSKYSNDGIGEDNWYIVVEEIKE